MWEGLRPISLLGPRYRRGYEEPDTTLMPPCDIGGGYPYHRARTRELLRERATAIVVGGPLWDQHGEAPLSFLRGTSLRAQEGKRPPPPGRTDRLTTWGTSSSSRAPLGDTPSPPHHWRLVTAEGWPAGAGGDDVPVRPPASASPSIRGRGRITHPQESTRAVLADEPEVSAAGAAEHDQVVTSADVADPQHGRRVVGPVGHGRSEHERVPPGVRSPGGAPGRSLLRPGPRGDQRRR